MQRLMFKRRLAALFAVSCLHGEAAESPRSRPTRKKFRHNFERLKGFSLSVPGALKLDHLQPVEPMLFPKFSNFYIFILGNPILFTPERGRLKMGKWISPNLSETQGFECLGHSNWTICSLLSQFCSLNFPTSTSLYWGAQFLLPQREESWKWENGILPTCVRHRGLGSWGIQTGPYAAC